MTEDEDGDDDTVEDGKPVSDGREDESPEEDAETPPEVGEGDQAAPDAPDHVDEKIRRLERIVRALESGAVDPDERAAFIAEGKALVAELELDLEMAEDGREE